MARITLALRGAATAIAFGEDHLDDLTAARRQFTQGLCRCRRHGSGRRPDCLGEMGDRGGIEPIGLGKLAGGARKIADLARVDHRQRQLRRGQRAGNNAFLSAGRRHDRSGAGRPARRARRRSFPRRGADAHQADPWTHRYRQTFPVPSLRMRARPGFAAGTAPATVRAEGTGGWGTVLRSGLIGPRSQRAPIRHRSAQSTPAPRPGTRYKERPKGASRRTHGADPAKLRHYRGMG